MAYLYVCNQSKAYVYAHNVYACVNCMRQVGVRPVCKHSIVCMHSILVYGCVYGSAGVHVCMPPRHAIYILDLFAIWSYLVSACLPKVAGLGWSCMYVCIYELVLCAYIYIYIYIYWCNVHVRVCVCGRPQVMLNVCMYVCLGVMCIYICVCMCVCMAGLRLSCMYVCM